MLQPRIEFLPAKKLRGKKMTMSLTNNKTRQLWRSFMENRGKIPNPVGTDLYSLQVYGDSYFNNFTPQTEFIKWAAIEVAGFDAKADGMEDFTLDAGEYAVFDYKGSSSDPTIFQYIYQTWLTQSGYILDNRPHFEVLGEKYKNDHPDSEEEIWIPIRKK